MAFPTSLTNAVDEVTEVVAAHLNSLEAKVGIDGSLVTTSLDYLLKNPASLDPGHRHTGLYNSDGSVKVVTIDANGNLGIGTATPGGPLQVVGTNGAAGSYILQLKDSNYLANGGEVLSVHANSQKPWIARFYNDSYSATTPIFAYFGYDNGNFSMGTYGARDLGLFVGNHYGSEELVIKGSTGNVGIGITSPNAAALLHLSSTNKGFLPPVMTTAQKTAITSPPAGLVVYDSTLNKLCVYTGSSWETITSS